MKKKYKRLLSWSLAGLLILTACGEASNEGETKEQDEEVAEEVQTETVEPVDRPLLLGEESLKAKYELTADLTPYQVSGGLPEVTNLDYFNEIRRPVSPEEEELLAKNLFVVRSSLGFTSGCEFFEPYEKNRYDMIPNFITADSLLHTYHIYFEYLVKNTEKKFLKDQLTDLTASMLTASQDQLEALEGTDWSQAAQRNLDYFAVPGKLLGLETEGESDKVGEEMALIDGAEGPAESPVMEASVDYSQFTPRGHYTDDKNLEAYFKAMQWYGQVNFPVKDEEKTKSAILINQALASQEEDHWENIYDVTAFFFGQSDDLGYYEFKPALEEAYGEDWKDPKALAKNSKGWKAFAKSLEAMPLPQVNSIPGVDSEAEEEGETKGFRFMGQRTTLDGVIMNRLVEDKVKENSEGASRDFPDVLDVPAAMGSDKAMEILDEEGATDFKEYPDQMEKLQKGLEEADEKTWNASVYSAWLQMLSTLLEDKEEGYPAFMESGEWAKKSLETFAGSYTELAHDAILYRKPLMSEMGAMDPDLNQDDRGYVQPEPDLYGFFINMVEKLKEGLDGYGLLSDQEAEDMDKLAAIGQKLMDISIKELGKEDLSEEDYDFIRTYGGQLEHFWTEVNKDKMDESGILKTVEIPAPLVTDIATNADAGQTLTIGTGPVSEILVIFPIDGELHLGMGAAYSFYQFLQPLDKRLTDEEWQAKFSMGPIYLEGMVTGDKPSEEEMEVPDRPDWTQSYRSADQPGPAYF